jgi:hypothetical protein
MFPPPSTSSSTIIANMNNNGRANGTRRFYGGGNQQQQQPNLMRTIKNAVSYWLYAYCTNLFIYLFHTRIASNCHVRKLQNQSTKHSMVNNPAQGSQESPHTHFVQKVNAA